MSEAQRSRGRKPCQAERQVEQAPCGAGSRLERAPPASAECRGMDRARCAHPRPRVVARPPRRARIPGFPHTHRSAQARARACAMAGEPARGEGPPHRAVRPGRGESWRDSQPAHTARPKAFTAQRTMTWRQELTGCNRLRKKERKQERTKERKDGRKERKKERHR